MISFMSYLFLWLHWPPYHYSLLLVDLLDYYTPFPDKKMDLFYRYCVLKLQTKEV